MHILTISTLYPNPKRPLLGVFVENQARHFAALSGVRLSIINPIGIPPWPLSRHRHYHPLAELPQISNEHGLSIYRPKFALLPKFGGLLNPSAITRAIRPLVMQIDRESPIDLLDAQFFYPDGPVVAKLSEEFNLPCSIKARGADIHHWGAQPRYRAKMLKSAQRASGMLAVTAALRANMAALGMDRAKIKVHYTGCDQALFRPHRSPHLREGLGMNRQQKLIVSVGALIARKRHLLAINALKSLPDAHLLIAGEGEERALYQQSAQQLGVADRLHLPGNLDRAELADWLAEADISLLVSSSEGLANAWVEALASGTPLVASDIGGARELLRDPVAGRLVQCHKLPSDRMSATEIAQDAAKIAAALREMLAKPSDPEAVRAQVANFTWQNNAQNLHQHYRQILANRDGGAPK